MRFIVMFVVVTSWRDVVCDSSCMTGTCDTFKMFSFSVMQSTFRFSNVGSPDLNLVVTRIINGHFWKFMSKHTKRLVKVK